MLENDLNINFNLDQLITHQLNQEYGFEIKSLRLEKEGVLLLFTSGLSNTNQFVDENSKALEKIELYFCLPEYFDLKKEQWPIYWLDRVASIPQKNKTWLGLGDTIPAGKPPEAISDKLTANHFVIMNPYVIQKYLNEESEVYHLAIVPIFQEELDYKLRNSYTILFKKFSKNGITEMVDIYRSSCCRKRILGMI